MSDQELDSTALSAALSHLTQTTASGIVTPALIRPLRARPIPDPDFWNLSLKSPDPVASDWCPLTGCSFPQSQSQQNVAASQPQTPSEGYGTGSLYPSTCVSPESSPRKRDDVTGASGSDLMWPQFFGNERITNDGAYGMGRSHVTSAMGQMDPQPESGYGYWSEATFTQPAARPAPLWSSASPFSSLFTGSGQVNNVPPGFSNGSTLNSQAWNRSSNCGFARQPQPDYLTGLTSSGNSFFGRIHNNSMGQEISALEEQFRDFKLKPQILSEQYKLAAAAGRKSRPRSRRPTSMQCVFCLSNGEDEKVFKSHVLKDPDGRVRCPVLRLYNCPVCNNYGGDYAHTIKYCPRNKPAYKCLIRKTGQGQADMPMRSRFQSPTLNRK